MTVERMQLIFFDCRQLHSTKFAASSRELNFVFCNYWTEDVEGEYIPLV